MNLEESLYQRAIKDRRKCLEEKERLVRALRVASHSPHDQAGEPNGRFPTCSECGAIQTAPSPMSNPRTPPPGVDPVLWHLDQVGKHRVAPSPDAPDWFVAACAHPAFPGGGDGAVIASYLWPNVAPHIAALPPTPPLDVERLARALHVNTELNPSPYETCPQTVSGWHRKSAETIAREYAAQSEEGKE